MQEHIKLENISVRYGRKTVLKNINLVVNKGETVALLGPSGLLMVR